MVATGTALALGGGALLGGIAGALGDNKNVTQDQSSHQSQDSGIRLGAASNLENYAGSQIRSNYDMLNNYMGAGPGLQDVQAGYQSQQDLASLLKQMQESGGLPGQEDIAAGNGLANNLFNARRLSLSNSFQEQMSSANQQAALMGRSMNDPILRAKLAQEQTRQSGMLAAEQNDLATQLAMNLPGQRLGFAQQRAGLLGGLASQAMANRQALLSLGQNLQANERAFRVETGERYGNTANTSYTSQNQSGGTGGAISGGIAGAFAGVGGIASGMKGLQGLFGGNNTVDLSNTTQLAPANGIMDLYGRGVRG
jgi:hypothetical protein